MVCSTKVSDHFFILGGIMKNRSLTIVALFLLLSLAPGLLQAEEMTFETIFHLDKDQTYNCSFGLRQGSSDGLDGFDLVAPPAAPDEDLDGFLSMVNPPPGMPNRWYRDFRPVENLTLDRVEYFSFHLASTHLGEQASISIATGAFNSLPYEMWIFGPNGLYQQVDVPYTINFMVTSSMMDFIWELRLDDGVPVTDSTWSGIKSLFR